MTITRGKYFDIYNPVIVEDIPCLDYSDFRSWVDCSITEGLHLSAFMPFDYCTATKEPIAHSLLAIFANNASSEVNIAALEVSGNEYESLTPDFPQFHIFEREIYENRGIMPIGHPWLKPVRFPSDSKFADSASLPDVGEIDFFRVSGEEIHQVAVGPVHAGIIEPGHFRFQCHGEIVHHLEISLGYQHRGLEKMLRGKHGVATMKAIEVAAGDSTIANALAYSYNIEKLSSTKVSENAELLRLVALELERCANHIGDLGAMAGDVGYLPTMSYCGRIRGDFLNMTALLCGNRFGRGLVSPGGTAYSLDNNVKDELLRRLEFGRKDFLSAVDILWDSSSVLARFEDTGTVSADIAKKIGMVGVAARASGVEIDARSNRQSEVYRRFDEFVTAIEKCGDVAARARVRYNEVINSINLIQKFLERLDTHKELKVAKSAVKSNRIAVSFVEGWRGEICHIAQTDDSGNFKEYKIVDPSMHNWYGLALAMRGEKISDFPICNKSFSLSYCGFDL